MDAFRRHNRCSIVLSTLDVDLLLPEVKLITFDCSLNSCVLNAAYGSFYVFMMLLCCICMLINFRTEFSYRIKLRLEFIMKNDEISHNVEKQNLQMRHENSISEIGPIMQAQNGSSFLTVLTFACEALIACARQLDIMDAECSDGNYGTTLAHSASAIKLAIKEGRISATRPSITFMQISHIIEEEISSLEGGIYSLFFDTVAKSFLRFRNDEQMTANMWLTALASANKMISEVSGTSLGDRTMLDALIPAENKLRDALNSGSNPVNAFGEAVKAAETFAMQTVHMSDSHPVDSTNFKTFKYPDPGAHAVGIWMRAAYEGVKLKFGYEFGV